MRSFRPAVSLVCLMFVCGVGLLPASADVFNYDGEVVLCTTTCNSFGALGSENGGSNNLVNSIVTGSIEIAIQPDGSFSFVVADAIPFSFEIFSPALPLEAPIINPDPVLPVCTAGVNPPDCCPQPNVVGQLCNATTVNPIPLDPTVAEVSGMGNTGADGNFTDGNIDVRFTAAPFSNNQGEVYFDLSDGSAEGFVFGTPPVILFTRLAGTYTVEVLPGVAVVAPTSVDFGDVVQNTATATDTVTLSNTGMGPLTVTSVDTMGISAPLAADASACTAASPLAPAGTCDITVSLATADVGNYTGSFIVNTDDTNNAAITVNVSGNVVVPPAPNLVFTPASLTFQSTIVNNFAAETVTISNDGDADLTIGTIGAVDTLAAPFQIVLDGCSNTTVTPAGSCDLDIQFMPVAAGPFMDSFDVPSNDADDPITYMLDGSAVTVAEPEVSADPESVDFGELLLNQFDTAEVELTNPGTGTLTFTSITLSGDSEFSQTNDCGATLDVQAICTVSIVLNGSSGGTKTADLVVLSDATADPTLTVPLMATIFEGPRITVDPAALDIGSAAAPIDIEQSDSGSVTISNEGASPLTITAISLASVGGMSPDEFSFVEDCTNATVDVGATCSVEVTFAPITAGDKTTAVVINSDDADSPALQVPVTGYVFAGSGLQPSETEVMIGSEDVTTEVGESSSTDVTITSSGTDDLIISAISIGGDNPGDFSFMDDCTAAALPRGSSCTITVTFTPTTGGQRTAVLEISDNTTTRALRQIVLTGFAAFPPPPPPPPLPGSATTAPPAFATGDSGSDGACFIATAAFGSYLDPNVKVLRNFRDNVLLPTGAGRDFVKFYYSNSPVVADFIARNDAARMLTRWLLTPLVYALAYPAPALAILFGAWFAVRRRRVLRTA